MQERRTTVRVRHQCQSQYCPSDALLPRTARLINLSERGARLLVREPHRIGEQITVKFPLGAEDEDVTANGVVRWSQASGSSGRSIPIGLEWLPLEETARHRLLTFLRDPSSRTRMSPALTEGSTVRRVIILASVITALLIASPVGLWLLSLRKENQVLRATIQQRTLLAHHLEQQGQQMRDELLATKTQLGRTVGQVLELDQHAQQLEGQMHQLTQDVTQVQQSYTEVRKEREALMQRVLALEEERMELKRKLSSIPELRLAIHEAIAARREAQRAQRRQQSRTRASADSTSGSREPVGGANHGYLIREGRPTISRSTMWIRIHEPEPLSPTPVASPPQLE